MSSPRLRAALRGSAALAPLLAALALVACSGAQTGGDEPLVMLHDGRTLERTPRQISPLPRGVAIPYPLERIYGTFGDCRPGGRQHRGLDIGGVGPDAGLGTPVRAMVRAEVVQIARPEDDHGRWGRPDTRGGTTTRSGVELPRGGVVSGYGHVDFFTRDYGSAQTGAMIVTRAIGPPIEGYRVRYMHLGAVHPELRVGDIVEAGQELGVMGGTAVLESLPHVHIDIETPAGVRVDVAPLLGLEPDTSVCR